MAGIDGLWIALALVSAPAAAPPRALAERGDYAGPVSIVPNFRPASCGWLTDFSTELNYCAYSCLEHLDRVRDDPNYRFALLDRGLPGRELTGAQGLTGRGFYIILNPNEDFHKRP